MIKAKVTRIESKDIYVITPESIEYRCVLPGRIKKSFNLKKDKLHTLDIVAVGDFVKIEKINDDRAVIESVLPRINYISRKAPKIRGAGIRGQRLEQIIAANVDLFIHVTSVHEPEFNNKFVDRMIVIAESNHVDFVLVINKIDLDHDGKIREWEKLYRNLGYSVIVTSVTENKNLATIKELLNNKTVLFWGQSGVGKSSLLNQIDYRINLKVGDISDYSGKGKHTTVTSRLIRLDNMELIDTPGIRELEPYGIRKEDLGHYFVEFPKYIPECRFNSCTHFHEPGCAVRSAVESEEISVERYESYLNLLQTVEEDIIF